MVIGSALGMYYEIDIGHLPYWCWQNNILDLFIQGDRGHYLEAPMEVRKARVIKRNSEKDPKVYAFEVTDFMFKLMEPRFEIPDAEQLSSGKKIVAGQVI